MIAGSMNCDTMYNAIMMINGIEIYKISKPHQLIQKKKNSRGPYK